jgi:hypothetical protein
MLNSHNFERGLTIGKICHYAIFLPAYTAYFDCLAIARSPYIASEDKIETAA